MKNKFAFLSLVVVAAALFSFRVAAPVNFSGTWKLNEGKSELGQFGARAAASKIVVDQKTESVSITTTATGFDGSEMTNTDVLSEGKEVEGTGFGGAKRKSTLKWAADGQGFTINSNITFDQGGQSFEIQGKQVWSMNADGKNLTLSSTITTPQGEFSTKAVYDKQ